MKAVHIIGKLSAGGVETWLKDLSSYQKHDMHILVQKAGVGFYDNLIRGNGSTVELINIEDGFFYYTYKIFSYFIKNKIEVVHSHVNLSSAWILLIALLSGVKVRVAHCHNDKRKDQKSSSLIKVIYYKTMKCLLHFVASHKIAVSQECASSMFYDRAKVKILPCGLSFERKGRLYREDLSIGTNDFVITHVGRFVEQKNHLFLVDLIYELKESPIKLLLVGDGNTQPDIKRIVSEKNLDCKVIFLGLRDDVNDILHDLTDLFVLPSLFEGLGLVAIEAQYNKVVTIVSENVPKAVDVSNRVKHLPLDDFDSWVSEIKKLIDNRPEKKDFFIKENIKLFTIEYNNSVLDEIYNGK
ncbi:putative glycosyltransferase EpsF [compost metagenome]